MNIIKVHDSIYKIEDFITEDEASTILSAVNGLAGDWNGGSKSEFWLGKSKDIELFEIERIRNRIEALFTNYLRINRITTVHRFVVGKGMGNHTDNVVNPDIKYGVVAYLNDDYEGGEICYPDLDIKVKPKARSIVIHKGDLVHYVSPVLSGNTRYFLTTFVAGSELTKTVIENF